MVSRSQQLTLPAMNASSTCIGTTCGTAARFHGLARPASIETREEVERVGRERLHPSITNSSWLVLRERRRLFEQWLAQLPRQRLSVLDVGGRIQPYRALLKGREEKYVAIDMRASPLVHVRARAEQIPLPDECFDLAICTQVLQYVADPARALMEIYRLLKPGGFLLLSVPAAYPRDSEHEYWRFLPNGIRKLLCSFGRIEIVPEGGTISGVCRTVAVWITMFARPPFLRALLQHSAVPAVNLGAIALEPLLGKGNDQFAVNYSIWAQK